MKLRGDRKGAEAKDLVQPNVCENHTKQLYFDKIRLFCCHIDSLKDGMGY